MTDAPVVKGLLWLEPRHVARLGHTKTSLRAHFTVVPRKFGEKAKPIDPTEVDRHGNVGVPLVEGVRLCAEAAIKVDDSTLARKNGMRLVAQRIPNLQSEKAPPGQKKFTEDLLEACKNNYAAVGSMKTGGGKTVSALYIAAKLGLPTIVIVPSNSIAAQWRDEAKLHLGLTDANIGMVKSGVIPTDKPLVIGVVHNLIDPVPNGYETRFGLAIFDEAHRMGAREFSKAAGKFAALYRLAITATPRRKDGCWQLVEYFMGPVLVQADGDNMETNCYPIDFPWELPPRMEQAPLAVVFKFLATHYARNKRLAELVMQVYREGRFILVMSSSVAQLQRLQKLCKDSGIPESEMAFFAGFIWSDYIKGIGKLPVKQAERDAIRNSTTLRVVFGTYQQMVEGVSIDWLDTGIDALPRSDGEQMVGRLRRIKEGKNLPCWITPVDINIEPLKRLAYSRIATIRNAGVIVVE